MSSRDTQIEMEEDHLRIMLVQESGAYRCPDYLSSSSSSISSSQKRSRGDDDDSDIDDQNYLLAEMNEVWRRKICEWSYKVVDHFRFDREVVSICLNYLDRFLAIQKSIITNRIAQPSSSSSSSSSSSGKTNVTSVEASEGEVWDRDGLVDSKSFQLAAMTALYLSAKVHAESSDGGGTTMMKRRKKLTLNFFVDLSRGQFASDDLVEMERIMLIALTWRMNPPTPMKFVAYMLRLLPLEDDDNDNNGTSSSSSIIIDERVVHVIYELSRYLTELSVCVYCLSVRHLPSTIAFASILISMDMIDPSALSYTARSVFLKNIERVTTIHVAMNEVKEAMLQIRAICPEICENHNNASDAGDFADDAAAAAAVPAHPITIARDAGFLVSPLGDNNKTAAGRLVVGLESPVCVSKAKGTKGRSRHGNGSADRHKKRVGVGH